MRANVFEKKNAKIFPQCQDYKWKTTFQTQHRNFEYSVMPFRLASALVIFQHFIHNIQWDLLDQLITAYQDDILIFSEDPGQHI